MARIAFFNERLPPDPDPVSGFAYELIRSLADQQHDVRVFSTYRAGDELPSAHPRIQILRPFKHWSWLEVPRLIPLLLEFRPDIIHVIEPRAEALRGLSNALDTLPALLSLFKHLPAVVSSYYDLRTERLRRHRPLLRSSDAVTVSNTPQLRLLEEFFSLSSRRPTLTLLPVSATARSRATSPETNEETPSVASAREILREFLDSEHDLIFVPGDIDAHRAPSELFRVLTAVLEKNPRAAIVFGGGWGDIPPHARHDLMRIFADTDHRVLFTGRLSPADEAGYLARAKFAFMASLPVESLWLARLLRTALEASALPVLTEEQAGFDALSWRHGENAWIVGSNANDWASALTNALASHTLVNGIRERLPEFSRSAAIDQPSNAMSRLYASVLDRRNR